MVQSARKLNSTYFFAICNKTGTKLTSKTSCVKVNWFIFSHKKIIWIAVISLIYICVFNNSFKTMSVGSILFFCHFHHLLSFFSFSLFNLPCISSPPKAEWQYFHFCLSVKKVNIGSTYIYMFYESWF